MTHARHVVITCEHGGREVPPDYAGYFAAHAALLDSHRGWDPGALELGREMAEALGAPLYASTTTRLLIDLNRSIGHRQLFSEPTRALSRRQREAVAQAHYRPHRDTVEGEIARRIGAGERVIHIASHSFTPELDGVQRRADVAWLYDPRRAGESALSRHWQAALARRAPTLKLRRNYPYQGRGDGVASLLRRRFPDPLYLGIELEVNQRFVARGGPAWDTLRAQVVASLVETLAHDRP